MRDDFLKDFAGATISGDEFIDAGDSVVVRVDQRATGPRSGAPVRMRYFQVWTFRGGAVIRIESIMERADALAAAGLSER
jgi:ketosteroid isomerase-like protein